MENLYGNQAVNISAGDEMIFAEHPKTLQLPICDKTIVSDLSEDFTLPDYQPEIRRLLRITPTVSPASHYVSRGLAEFAGNVDWRVLYVGADGEIAEAKLASPYDVACEFDNSDELDTDSFAADAVAPENVVGRVTAPRRLTIRCRLKHRVTVCGEKDSELDIFGSTSPESIKKLTRTLPVNKVVSGIDDSVELEHVFSLGEGAKAVGARADIVMDNAEADNIGIICRGTACLKLLYLDASQKPQTLEQRLPFTANAASQVEGDGWNCRAFGKATDVSVDQNDAEVVCRLRVTVCAEAQKNLPVRLTSDIFSTSNECDKTVESLTMPCSVLCGCYPFVHDGSAKLEALPQDARVIDTDCIAEANELVLEKGGYVLLGNCRYNVIFEGDDEYSVREIELPFRCELGSGSDLPSEYYADISVSSCKVRPEGENYAFSAELCAALRACSESETELVSAAEFGKERDTARAAFTVAYTSNGDTLWDIAKKYAADPLALAESNGLRAPDPAAPDSLAGVKYLVI